MSKDMLNKNMLKKLFGEELVEKRFCELPLEEKDIAPAFSYRPEDLKLQLNKFLSRLKHHKLTYEIVSKFLEIPRVKLCGNDALIRERAQEEIKTRPVLETLLILNFAGRNSDLRDRITERASIRYAENLSDSLFTAVLCNYVTDNTELERAECEYRPSTTWHNELKSLGIVWPNLS